MFKYIFIPGFYLDTVSSDRTQLKDTRVTQQKVPEATVGKVLQEAEATMTPARVEEADRESEPSNPFHNHTPVLPSWNSPEMNSPRCIGFPVDALFLKSLGVASFNPTQPAPITDFDIVMHLANRVLFCSDVPSGLGVFENIQPPCASNSPSPPTTTTTTTHDGRTTLGCLSYVSKSSSLVAMPLQDSSYCSLLPYRTRALFTGKSLQAHLPESGPVTWIAALEDYIRNIAGHRLPWGYHAYSSDVLFDSGKYSLTTPSCAQIQASDGSGKFVTSVSRGLGAFTSAILLYDLLVWLEGDKSLQQDVLVHARQRGQWVGKWSIYEEFGDLVEWMSEFTEAGIGLLHVSESFTSGTPLPPHVEAAPTSLASWTKNMAAEYSTLCAGQRAITVTRNIMYLAFSIRVMFQEAQIAVPENIFEHLSPNRPKKRKGASAGLWDKDVYDLRNALLAALAISPLLALGPKDLSNTAPLPEELIINRKLFGNEETPAPIDDLERTFWLQLFKVVRGECSALQVVQKLTNEWRGNDWTKVLEGCHEHFKQGPIVPFSRDFSPVQASVLDPIPSSWAIPDISLISIVNRPPELSQAVVESPAIPKPAPSSARPETPQTGATNDGMGLTSQADGLPAPPSHPVQLVSTQLSTTDLPSYGVDPRAMPIPEVLEAVAGTPTVEAFQPSTPHTIMDGGAPGETPMPGVVGTDTNPPSPEMTPPPLPPTTYEENFPPPNSPKSNHDSSGGTSTLTTGEEASSKPPIGTPRPTFCALNRLGGESPFVSPLPSPVLPPVPIPLEFRVTPEDTRPPSHVVSPAPGALSHHTASASPVAPPDGSVSTSGAGSSGIAVVEPKTPTPKGTAASHEGKDCTAPAARKSERLDLAAKANAERRAAAAEALAEFYRRKKPTRRAHRTTQKTGEGSNGNNDRDAGLEEQDANGEDVKSDEGEGEEGDADGEDDEDSDQEEDVDGVGENDDDDDRENVGMRRKSSGRRGSDGHGDCNMSEDDSSEDEHGAVRRESVKPAKEGKGSSVENAIVIDDSDVIIIDDDEKDEEVTKRAEAKVLHQIRFSLKNSPLTPGKKLPLQIHARRPRYSDTRHDTFAIFSLDGTSHLCKPEVFVSSDYEAWCRLLRRAGTLYSDINLTGVRRPRFLDDPSRSALALITAHDFSRSLTQEVQMRFANRCIGIPGDQANGVFSDGDSLDKAFAGVDWTLRGLRKVHDMQNPVDIHDQTLQVIGENHQSRVRTGTLFDMFASTQLSPEKQKSLNSLDFPDPCAKVSATPYATDVRAAFRTYRDPGCPANMPTSDIRWMVVGTKGAHSYFHQDPRGEGSYLFVACGEKIMIIATPKDPSDFASTRAFSSDEFNVRELDLEKYDIEVVLLRPGDKLMLQPATLHAALTKEHCVLFGGHFLSVSTLARTVVGGVHTFFEPNVTNTDHPTTLSRIHSVIAFLHKTMALGERGPDDEGHIPTLDSVESLRDLLFVACGVELQNAICETSYQLCTDVVTLRLLQLRQESAQIGFDKHDISGMPYSIRLGAVYSRGRMQDLLRVVFQKVEVIDEAGQQIEDPMAALFVPMLAHFISALRDYYQASVKIPTNTLPDRHWWDRQIDWTTNRASKLWPTLAQELNRLEGREITNLIYNLPASEVRISRKLSQPSGERDAAKLFSAGMRMGDYAYFSVVMPSLVTNQVVLERERPAKKIQHQGSPQRSMGGP
ncbi:hypothetical protein NMY22_g6870 [Coprinellus aureogranulatus]|nr:hypothetical protein NMY22_g6870 [Coprinellus aureogranulatus]